LSGFRFDAGQHFSENFMNKFVANLDSALVKPEPYNAMALVMNYDTQPGQMVAIPIEGFFKPLAYALILLRQEGYPQLFYSDFYGMKGKEGTNPEPVACRRKAA
jgi:alpha-amylase